MSDPLYVAVCGPGDATEDEARWAEEIGRGLGQARAVLLCGGLGGVMEAAARGASEAGGITVGFLPNEDRAGANRFLTVALPLGLGEARNALIVRAADAVVAVSGEWGTLSEIALALKMGKPVIGLETWRVSKGQDEVEGIRRASTPAEAVELALRGT